MLILNASIRTVSPVSTNSLLYAWWDELSKLVCMATLQCVTQIYSKSWITKWKQKWRKSISNMSENINLKRSAKRSQRCRCCDAIGCAGALQTVTATAGNDGPPLAQICAKLCARIIVQFYDQMVAMAASDFDCERRTESFISATRTDIRRRTKQGIF